MTMFKRPANSDIGINEKLVESVEWGGFFSGRALSEIVMTNKARYRVFGSPDEVCAKLSREGDAK